MVNNYTDLSIINYLYQETDICEKLEMEHLIETDPEVRDRYQSFSMLSNILSDINYTPKDLTIHKLIMYSQVEDVHAN